MKPLIYTASKVHRAPMWRKLREEFRGELTFNASWINEDITPMDDANPIKCANGWVKNINEASHCHYLVCAALPGDELSGTLVEIGAALGNLGMWSNDAPVYLVGENERWATWRFHPKVVIPKTTGVLERRVAQVLTYIVRHWRTV